MIIFSFEKLYAQEQGKQIKILSTINPIHQIVKAIASDNQTFLLVDANSSAHDYMLKPSDLRKVNQADVIFYVSDDLEFYLRKIINGSNNKAKVIRLIDIDGIKLLPMRLRDDKYSKKSDPHIWLNPENAIIIATYIAQTLSEMDVENADKYQANLKRFTVDVKGFIARNRKDLAKISAVNYVIYHNAYQYFEDYYGLQAAKVISYHHHQHLSVRDMQSLAKLIKEDDVQCLFGQKQEEAMEASRIAQEQNIKFILLDIIGSKEDSYLQLFNKLVGDFSSCLSGK